jgi:hypothetical protein
MDVSPQLVQKDHVAEEKRWLVNVSLQRRRFIRDAPVTNVKPTVMPRKNSGAIPVNKNMKCPTDLTRNLCAYTDFGRGHRPGTSKKKVWELQ